MSVPAVDPGTSTMVPRCPASITLAAVAMGFTGVVAASLRGVTITVHVPGVLCRYGDSALNANGVMMRTGSACSGCVRQMSTVFEPALITRSLTCPAAGAVTSSSQKLRRILSAPADRPLPHMIAV